MKPYIISYDIKETAKGKFQPLFDEIKKSKKWWHYISNTWLILTNETASEINERLKPHLDSNINLIIFELGSDRQGWLSPKAWKWIKANIPK